MSGAIAAAVFNPTDVLKVRKANKNCHFRSHNLRTGPVSSRSCPHSGAASIQERDRGCHGDNPRRRLHWRPLQGKPASWGSCLCCTFIDLFVCLLYLDVRAQGVGTTIVRASLLTSAQMASYDESKHVMLDLFSFRDNFFTHFWYTLASHLHLPPLTFLPACTRCPLQCEVPSPVGPRSSPSTNV
jgi:hypothetical protein